MTDATQNIALPLARVLTADCREVMPDEGPFDMIIADPPYGDTSLEWDRHVDGWLPLACRALKPSGSIWIFGSMRFFLAHGAAIEAAGLRYAQDIVWEKHNGSGFAADRFRRVHEHVVQFYRADSPWSGVFNQPQQTADAVARTVRRKKRPPHLGGKDEVTYVSEDGGPRLMRSVIFERSCHGRAIHPTEKPAALLEVLIKTSTPPLDSRGSAGACRRLVRGQRRGRRSGGDDRPALCRLRDRSTHGGQGQKSDWRTAVRGGAL